MTEIKKIKENNLKEVTGGENAIYGGMVGTTDGNLKLSDCVNIVRSVNENAGAIKVGGAGGIVSNVTGSTAMGDSVNIKLIDPNAGVINAGGITGKAEGNLSITDCKNTGNLINGGSI